MQRDCCAGGHLWALGSLSARSRMPAVSATKRILHADSSAVLARHLEPTWSLRMMKWLPRPPTSNKCLLFAAKAEADKRQSDVRADRRKARSGVFATLEAGFTS